ncbi:hypothetical protein NPIL_512881 [Nephila pilipes]|uniref:Uncharacterized protein n=1 Tax=Nephila pilipes TaxID=299642 RepID=A0A8X6QMV4_NEPPI|nr:hypothetical protein NPIL_512881 [Nephila pilipes]
MGKISVMNCCKDPSAKMPILTPIFTQWITVDSAPGTPLNERPCNQWVTSISFLSDFVDISEPETKMKPTLLRISSITYFLQLNHQSTTERADGLILK